eukprot:scaffold151604_cov18-Tisochrysis_lutea.AAC.1
MRSLNGTRAFDHKGRAELQTEQSVCSRDGEKKRAAHHQRELILCGELSELIRPVVVAVAFPFARGRILCRAARAHRRRRRRRQSRRRRRRA